MLPDSSDVGLQSLLFCTLVTVSPSCTSDEDDMKQGHARRAGCEAAYY